MTTSTTKARIYTLPNILTVFRMVAAAGVFFALLFLARNYAYTVALICFFLASITDFMDGWIARRFGAESALGKMLDPIADKVLIVLTGAALMTNSSADLGYVDFTLALSISLILFREVFVSGVREYLGNDYPLPVTWLAKWKTALQMIAFVLLIVEGILVQSYFMRLAGMDAETANAIIAGSIPDEIGLNFAKTMAEAVYILARVVLVSAAAATVITGLNYTARALNYILGKSSQ